MHLEPPNREIVAQAFRAAIARGVTVRLVYNRDANRRPPVPGGPMPTMVDIPFLTELPGIQVRVVPGQPFLMHHKYAVVDGVSVWSGSTNWTDDSWHRMENVIVRIDSPEIAALYRQDFEELWETRQVVRSGRESVEWLETAGVPLRVFFTPKRAPKLVHAIADSIYSAERRIRVCSPVVTSGPILASLADLHHDNLDIRGVVDATQMQEVLADWARDGNTVKPPLFHSVVQRFPFSGKHSTPWRPGPGLHDFMHAKCVVADDEVFVGSFNLSRNGETNAENVLQVRHAGLADMFVAFIDRVAARYPAYAAEGPA